MNSRLTIQDLATLLAERTGKDRSSAELFLREFIAVVSQGVFTDKIAKIKGLGTFKVMLVEKRESIHVNTGERFLIPAHYKFSFLPDKELRELVNKPFSFFETTELDENVEFTDLDISPETEEKETEDESVEELIPETITEEVVEATPASEEQSGSEAQPASDLTISQPEEQAEPEPEAATDLPEATEDEEEITESEPEPEEIPETVDEEPLPEVSQPDQPEAPAEQPVEEPEAEEKQPPVSETFPDTDYQFEDEYPSSSPWIKRLVVAGIIVLVAAGSTFLYLNRSFFLGPEKPSVLTGMSLPDMAAAPSETIAEADTLQIAEPEANTDTIEAVKDTIPAEVPADKPEVAQKKPEVLAKVKIEPGSRLTLISLEYYGSKIFWVYLYEYNKAVIKDPNNVPVGTEIRVPDPSVYGIDRYSRASVDKAAALQTEILAGKP